MPRPTLHIHLLDIEVADAPIERFPVTIVGFDHVDATRTPVDFLRDAKVNGHRFWCWCSGRLYYWGEPDTEVHATIAVTAPRFGELMFWPWALMAGKFQQPVEVTLCLQPEDAIVARLVLEYALRKPLTARSAALPCLEYVAPARQSYGEMPIEVEASRAVSVLGASPAVRRAYAVCNHIHGLSGLDSRELLDAVLRDVQQC